MEYLVVLIDDEKFQIDLCILLVLRVSLSICTLLYVFCAISQSVGLPPGRPRRGCVSSARSCSFAEALRLWAPTMTLRCFVLQLNGMSRSSSSKVSLCGMSP